MIFALFWETLPHKYIVHSLSALLNFQCKYYRKIERKSAPFHLSSAMGIHTVARTVAKHKPY